MNRFVRSCSTCVAASVAGTIGLLILVGCAALPNVASADLDFSTSNVSPDSSGAPSGGLRVDMRVFAEKGQNPVRLYYTVTNLYRWPVLAPVYITMTPREHIKVIDTNPAFGTTIAKNLKPGESATGFATLQIDPMKWQEGISIDAITAIAGPQYRDDSPEQLEALNKGGTALAFGGAGMAVRVKEGRIEASSSGGWVESQEPGFTIRADGTRVENGQVDPKNVSVRAHAADPEIQVTNDKQMNVATATP